MYSLNVVYKEKTKKMTFPKNINQQDLLALIRDSFKLKEKLIGLTNAKGNLVNIEHLSQKNEKETLYLITAQDLNGDNMSFASDGGDNMRQNFLFEEEKQPGFSNEIEVSIPEKGEGNYQGVIGDLELFESLFAEEGKMTIILCFIKEKPRNFAFPYYLYHTSKNSVMIYSGKQRICEFFVESMNDIPKEVTKFIKSSLGERENIRNEVENSHEVLKPFSKIKGKLVSKAQNNNFSRKNTADKKRRRELEKEFFEENLPQEDDEDNKEAQELLNEFGDSEPVEPLNGLHEEEEQEIFCNELEEEEDEEDLPIFEEQFREQKRGSKKEKNKEFVKNISSKGAIESEEIEEQEYLTKVIENEEAEIKASLLENLLKLKEDEDITELEFYRMKSELLENLSDFMRKYQMGTRKGFRKQQEQRGYDREENKPREERKKVKKANVKAKERQNKERPMSPLSASSSESELIAPERPEEKLRQRLKEREVAGEKKPRTYQERIQKQSQKQERENAEERQNRKRESKLPSQSQKEMQIYHEMSTRPQREPSPPLKNLPTPFSNERRRSKKYEIPIIVRKYNNVIEKISTSYPLSQEQEQAINLILELELKGLITEKESGVYKSSILQEDKDIFPLFLDYFDHLIDQLELVSRLKTIKRINSEKKERSQHNMRLLIKYAKQSSYELLRNLLLENNNLVLAALDRFRVDKNGDGLAKRLEKIAEVYKQKSELETEVFE